MRRRDFVLWVGALCALRPPFALAQNAVPVVGFLQLPKHEPAFEPLYQAFRDSLSEAAGLSEGRDYRIELRAADYQVERLPVLAADLVRAGATVITTSSGLPAVKAIKSVTETTPIVALISGDPVKAGIASSINRPGGTVTGVMTLSAAIVSKEVEIIHAMLPDHANIGMLIAANYDPAEYVEPAKVAAQRLGHPIMFARVGGSGNFRAALAQLADEGAKGLVVPGGPFFTGAYEKLAPLVAETRLPVIYSPGDLAAHGGGLMSYGASFADLWRQLGTLTAKVLRGAKPADLPIEQPARMILQVNLKVAKRLGIIIPLPLLARADEVIE